MRPRMTNVGMARSSMTAAAASETSTPATTRHLLLLGVFAWGWSLRRPPWSVTASRPMAASFPLRDTGEHRRSDTCAPPNPT